MTDFQRSFCSASYSTASALKVVRRSAWGTRSKPRWRPSTSTTTYGSSQRKTEESGDHLLTKAPKHVRQTGLLWLKRDGKPERAELQTLLQPPPFPVLTARDSSAYGSAWSAICAPTESTILAKCNGTLGRKHGNGYSLFSYGIPGLGEAFVQGYDDVSRTVLTMFQTFVNK